MSGSNILASSQCRPGRNSLSQHTILFNSGMHFLAVSKLKADHFPWCLIFTLCFIPFQNLRVLGHPDIKWRHFRMKFSSSRGTEQRLKTLFKFHNSFQNLFCICVCTLNHPGAEQPYLFFTLVEVFFTFLFYTLTYTVNGCVYGNIYSTKAGHCFYLSPKKSILSHALHPGSRWAQVQGCGRGGSSY